jgi:hypothetical protein
MELTLLNINDMPTLTLVCVWELPFPTAEITVNATGSPNVVYSATCGTGIQESLAEINRMKVYPNPAGDVVFVAIPDEGNYTLEITDITGKTVYSIAKYRNHEEINIDSFSKGIYIINVHNGNETFNGRVIIE